jgi:hypothetical protein
MRANAARNESTFPATSTKTDKANRPAATAKMTTSQIIVVLSLKSMNDREAIIDVKLVGGPHFLGFFKSSMNFSAAALELPAVPTT